MTLKNYYQAQELAQRQLHYELESLRAQLEAERHASRHLAERLMDELTTHGHDSSTARIEHLERAIRAAIQCLPSTLNGHIAVIRKSLQDALK